MNPLQTYVEGIMEAKNLRPMDLHKRSGINRTTLTRIIKGRYPLGSEKTRPTLLQLAKGLGLDSPAPLLRAAGLPLEAPRPAKPADDFSEKGAVLAEIRGLVARLEAAGLLPPAPPPGPSGRGDGGRTRQPPNGKPGSRRKGNPGT